MTAETSKDAPDASGNRQPWTPPALTHYGQVRVLTTGGSNPGVENNPFGCRNATVGPMGPCRP